jgi:hypothetical protein
MRKLLVIFFTLLFVCLISGCDGVQTEENGSSGGGVVYSLLSPDCSGANCGSSGSSYTGSGVGVWRYKNGGAQSAYLNVSLSNVADRDITIVFTNEGDSLVTMPLIYIDKDLKNEISGEYSKTDGEYIDALNHIPDVVREFDPKLLISKKSSTRYNYQRFAKTWTEGEERNWTISVEDKFGNSIYQNRTAALKKQQTLSNGITVNIWIENSEYGSEQVNDTMIERISQNLETIVSSAVNLIGKPWGTHEYSDELIPSEQPLDIVLVNFDKNEKALGIIGYFWSLNNFLNNYLCGSPELVDYCNHSNEALAVFVDTETLYKHEKGMLHGISTIAHEFAHVIHFYQRDVIMDDSFDTFLNEMSAIMMEDIVAKKIDNEFNDAKLRYIDWHNNTLYRYDFADWRLSGDANYDIAGSFGAYLMRQYGVEFYKTLFKTSSGSSTYCGEANTPVCRLRSLNILDKAIKTHSNNEGLGRALQRWGAGIAMLPYNASPNRFGYPRLNDPNGFEFEEFDGSAYKQYRRLPADSPASLNAHGHFPFLRKTTNNTFTETFIVPRNVSVSVIVK